MKIVGVTACTAGIAHTYIAKEKLIQAAKELGYEIKIETQGSMGLEDELTEDEIAAADVVILATDIGIRGKERFQDKRIVEMPVSYAVKSPKSVLQKIAEKISGK